MTIELPSGRKAFNFDCGTKSIQLVFAYYGLDLGAIVL
jgi:hypothetical protein